MRNTYPKPKPLCPLFAVTRKVLPDGNLPIKCQEERCAWWIQGVEGAAVADSGSGQRMCTEAFGNCRAERAQSQAMERLVR